MNPTSQPAKLCLAASLVLGLAACNGRNPFTNASSDRGTSTPSSSMAGTPTRPDSGTTTAPQPDTQVAAFTPPNLAEGPDVCFRAISKQLGPNAKVSEITSFFSVGSEIDSDETKPAGQLTTCSVQYQSPDDPRKLLETSLNMTTGQFEAPRPIEIKVIGGDAAKFNVENYLVPLSKVNAAALSSIMEAKKAKLSSVYSRYAWSGVRLSPPDAFSSAHTLRLDVDGRLASNDIKADGYASITTDGKTITTDDLLP